MNLIVNLSLDINPTDIVTSYLALNLPFKSHMYVNEVKHETNFPSLGLENS